jgi:hypothetical protein
MLAHEFRMLVYDLVSFGDHKEGWCPQWPQRRNGSEAGDSPPR